MGQKENKKFALNLKKTMGLLRDLTDQEYRKIVLELWDRTTERTPVLTGRAKGNWVATAKAPQKSIDEISGGDSAALANVAKNKNRLLADNDFRPGNPAFLANNVEYISVLEFGDTNRVANRMLRDSINDLKGIGGK